MTVASLSLDQEGKLSAPLNVCFPVNYLGYGGAERQLVELALGLDKDRFQVFVVTLNSGGSIESELKGKQGITLLSLERKSKYDLSPTINLARIFRRHQIHIVQPFLSPATLFTLTASLLSRTPVRIVTERCGLRKNRGLGNKLYRFIEDRLTPVADLAVANSEAGRRYLCDRGVKSSKTRVIYNGINPTRLDPDPAMVQRVRERLNVPSDGLVIGNVASLTLPKDQATILRAMASLKTRHPELRVALVGDGPLRSELERLAQDLNLSSSVVFFGNQHRVADYIAAFDVAVLSSVDNEGCSNFLLEAMGLGKPVVATDIGGNRELVYQGENGWLIPPGDPDALAAALEEALGDAVRREAFGDKGRRMVATRFSLPDMIEAHQQLYQELVLRKLGASSPLRDAAS